MFQYNWQKRIVAASPMISLFAFLMLGFITDAWLPSAAVFLLIPLSPFIVGLKQIKISFSIIIIAVYLVLGFVFNWWHPGWVLFLLIPIYYTLFGPGIFEQIKKNKKKQKDYIDAE